MDTVLKYLYCRLWFIPMLVKQYSNQWFKEHTFELSLTQNKNTDGTCICGQLCLRTVSPLGVHTDAVFSWWWRSRFIVPSVLSLLNRSCCNIFWRSSCSVVTPRLPLTSLAATVRRLAKIPAELPWLIFPNQVWDFSSSS